MYKEDKPFGEFFGFCFAKFGGLRFAWRIWKKCLNLGASRNRIFVVEVHAREASHFAFHCGCFGFYLDFLPHAIDSRVGLFSAPSRLYRVICFFYMLFY